MSVHSPQEKKPDKLQESPPNIALLFDPAPLDFGTLKPNVRKIQELRVTYLGEGIPRFSISYSEQDTWFRVVSTERVNADAPFPLTLKVAITTKFLAPGRRYDGWLTLHSSAGDARLAVMVQVASPPQRLRVVQRVAMIPVLLVVLFTVTNLLGIFSTITVQPSFSSQPAALSQPTAITQISDQLLFVIDENKQPVLYVANADGSDQHSLNLSGWSPAWSPKADTFAFINKDANGVPQIYVTQIGNGAPRQITATPTEKSMPTWSPDGQTIGFLAGTTAQQVLQLVDVQLALQQTEPITRVKQLLPALDEVDNGVEFVFPEASASPSMRGLTNHFNWSPDGQYLLFDLATETGRQIYQADQKELVLFITANGWEPVWSPNGTQVAFTMESGIYTTDPKGRILQQLTQFPAWSPRWSPDGKQIAFLSDQGDQQTNPDLWLMDADGQNQRRLTTTGCLDFSWASGQQLLYITGILQAQPPTLYLWAITPDAEPQLIAEISDPHIAWRQAPLPN